MLRKKWSHSAQIAKLKSEAPCLKDVTQSSEQDAAGDLVRTSKAFLLLTCHLIRWNKHFLVNSRKITNLT